MLCLAAAGAVVCWRRRTVWVLAGGALLAGALSLGVVLVVAPGRADGLWMPWRLLATVPVIENIVPQRFSALVDLFVAMLAGLALDGVWRAVRPRAQRKARSALACGALAASFVAVASLWWTYQVPLAARSVSAPAWFAEAGAHLRPGTLVLSIPFPFPSDGTSGPMVWQALDGMRFRLVGGYAKEPGPGGSPLSLERSSAAERVLARLSGEAAGHLPTGTARQVAAVRHALEAWGPRVVVVTDRVRDPARAVTILTKAIGVAPHRRLGAWVWVLASG